MKRASRIIASLFLAAVLAVTAVGLLVSCGRAPDPAFTKQTGDLSGFLLRAITEDAAPPAGSNSAPAIHATWHSRELTKRHKSGEYLEGRQALQIQTSATNFATLQSFFNGQLGDPAIPLRQEVAGWQHIGWRQSDKRLGVWLVQVDDNYRIEIVTEVSNRKP